MTGQALAIAAIIGGIIGLYGGAAWEMWRHK